MASKKLSALTEATEVAIDDVLYTVQSDGDKQVSLATLFGSIDLIATNDALSSVLDDKADLLTAVTISADTDLTAASHADRTLNITGASRVLTVQTDANSGAGGDEIFRAVPASGASCTMAADTGVTIVSADGSTLSSGTSATGEVAVQRIGTNTYRCLTPSVNGVRVLGLASEPVSIDPGDGSSVVSATVTVPANALGVKGMISIRGVIQRTGSTDTINVRISCRNVGGSSTTLLTVNMVAATTRLPFEIWLEGNRSDRTTTYATVQANGSPTGSSSIFTAANSLTLDDTDLDTSSDWEVIAVGNAATNDSWQLLTAVATIINP